MNILDKLTTTIKKIIDDKGLKHKYVAQKMGITERKFCDIINGRKVIDEEIIRLLCNALETRPDILFGYNKPA